MIDFVRGRSTIGMILEVLMRFLKIGRGIACMSSLSL